MVLKVAITFTIFHMLMVIILLPMNRFSQVMHDGAWGVKIIFLIILFAVINTISMEVLLFAVYIFEIYSWIFAVI
jgi:ABC-type transport system involved in Fe-S cluster assembly fused permease/ATPase subunit